MGVIATVSRHDPIKFRDGRSTASAERAWLPPWRICKAGQNIWDGGIRSGPFCALNNCRRRCRYRPESPYMSADCMCCPGSLILTPSAKYLPRSVALFSTINVSSPGNYASEPNRDFRTIWLRFPEDYVMRHSGSAGHPAEPQHVDLVVQCEAVPSTKIDQHPAGKCAAIRSSSAAIFSGYTNLT
jgi:hypothetical protein